MGHKIKSIWTVQSFCELCDCCTVSTAPWHLLYAAQWACYPLVWLFLWSGNCYSNRASRVLCVAFHVKMETGSPGEYYLIAQPHNLCFYLCYKLLLAFYRIAFRFSWWYEEFYQNKKKGSFVLFAVLWKRQWPTFSNVLFSSQSSFHHIWSMRKNYSGRYWND